VGEDQLPESRFPLGRTVATPGALEALSTNGQSPFEFFIRHGTGDWGDTGPDDRERNEEALKDGSRIFSVYTLRDETRIYVITEADRSATTILLPEEY
jgi:hypothetical protein